MNSQYEYIQQEGLYCDGVLICRFEPIVIGKKCYINARTGEKRETLLIKVVVDKQELETREIDWKDLENISFYKIWHVPDALLTMKDRRRLIYKLQTEAMSKTATVSLVCKAGLQFYQDRPLVVMGDEVIGMRQGEISTVIRDGFKMAKRERPYFDEEMERYLTFFPEVSEVLFYASLMAAIKPILNFWNRTPRFAVALIGRPGHLKTSMVQKYALWLENRNDQTITFQSTERVECIINRLNLLEGQTMLFDDLHKAASVYASQKQCNRLDTIVRCVSSEENCGSVIFTGESLEDTGIFSSRDRILQIKVPAMEALELQQKKRDIGMLPDDFMALIATKFVREIVKNWDETGTTISNFFTQQCRKELSVTRTAEHGKYLLLTERLFRRYLCRNDEQKSHKEDLEKTLEKNRKCQEYELEMILDEEVEDLVKVTYRIFTDRNKYIICDVDRNKYKYMYDNSEETERCFFENGKYYITSQGLQSALLNYFKRPISYRRVISALHDAAILEEDRDARTKKIFGKRHYVICKKLLDKYCENI